MSDQTTAPVEQSEQPKDVAQQPETTSEVKETVLAEATTEQKEAEPKVINFKDLIPEKYKEEKALSNFVSMDDFVKSYLSAQRLVGANKVAIPNKMATDEDWEEVYSKLGRPAKPEDYKYSFSEEEINQDQLKNFNETAHRIGLLPKQAERIIKFYNEMNTQAEVDNQKLNDVNSKLSKILRIVCILHWKFLLLSRHFTRQNKKSKSSKSQKFTILISILCN